MCVFREYKLGTLATKWYDYFGPTLHKKEYFM